MGVINNNLDINNQYNNKKDNFLNDILKIFGIFYGILCLLGIAFWIWFLRLLMPETNYKIDLSNTVSLEEKEKKLFNI